MELMKAYQGSSGPFFMKKKNVIPLSYVFFFHSSFLLDFDIYSYSVSCLVCNAFRSKSDKHGCMMPRYVAIYFSILYIRYRAGIVTDEMIALPKSRFMAIGILEALGVASGMASAGIIFIQFNSFFYHFH